MKTIGLIGGMSWQSSRVYYEYLNQLVAERLGGSHSAKILLNSVDFAEIEKLSFEGNWPQIGEIMADEAKRLEAGNADLIILGTNTIHLVSNSIKKATKLPFIHIAHATGEAITKKGIKKVGLLGTKFTMEKDFYTRILERDFGLEVVIPNEVERNALQGIIYKELVKGIFTKSTKEKCLSIINNLVLKGVQGVILGCTELPMLIPDSEVSVTTFDTTHIHSQKAVEFALS